MTRPFPDRDDLLATVREFLAELRPELEGQRRYQAQVAAYLLDIAMREGRLPGPPAIDLAGFRAAMRSGSLDGEETALAERLLDAAIAEVQVVRPAYLDTVHREN